MSVRVRFAPSPTGQVHIGNIRTAIFNWLFARNKGGKFLLRVEDTDRERSTDEAITNVLDAMQWLGLDFDEDPVYQSSQTEHHLALAEDLIERGLAYREDKGDTGKGECIIFRMPERGKLIFEDKIRGSIKKRAEDVKDFVIVRSDGTPVFHLANVADDISMGITHVIRGDDHMENTIRHVELYKALGHEPPVFAHLPMIVNNQGKPYSKRDGAAFVGDFRDQGFLGPALFNFLALLGWSPGDDLEIMSIDDMVRLFSLERVKSGAARFDVKKLTWMNGEYMAKIPRDEFVSRFIDELKSADLWSGEDQISYVEAICEQMHSRTKVYRDIVPANSYFFTDEYPFDEKARRKRLEKPGVVDLLDGVRACFSALEDFSVESTEKALEEYCEANDVGLGTVVHPVRVAVSGLAAGPGLFDMLALLGREKVLKRMERVAAELREQG